MKILKMTSLASLLALSTLTLVTAQAQASEPLTKTVDYSDLNLDSPVGAKVLYMRLRGAAQTVCHSLQGRSVRELSEYQVCFDQAIASAVSSINKPALSALENRTRPNAPVRLAAK